jgi:hypothetical protein
MMDEAGPEHLADVLGPDHLAQLLMDIDRMGEAATLPSQVVRTSTSELQLTRTSRLG